MNVLEIKNVKKSFNDSQLHVLKDISLTVAQGEVVAIIGPSGSGKSHLLQRFKSPSGTSGFTLLAASFTSGFVTGVFLNILFNFINKSFRT